MSILPQINNVTKLRAVQLFPRFSFGQDGSHSDERADRCVPPVFAAPCGKMSSLQVASAASIFVRGLEL